MKSRLTSKLIAMCGLLLLAIPAWSYIEDKPEGAEFHPEQSQGQVAEQQAKQGTQGVVGDVPLRTTPRSGSGSSKRGGGADVLAGASEELAANALVEAEEQIQAEQSAGFKWAWWAIGMLVLGLGVFFGIKTYADKTVPEQKRKRPNRW